MSYASGAFRFLKSQSAILAVKLRKRLGFGMWEKLHITGMHVEGKVWQWNFDFIVTHFLSIKFFFLLFTQYKFMDTSLDLRMCIC